MRLIDADLREVRSVAVSPDGRFVAASGTNGWYAVFDWASGDTERRFPLGVACEQLAFGPNDEVIYVQHDTLRVDRMGVNVPAPDLVGRCVAAAIAPDGKTLVATQAGTREKVELKRWSLPARQPLTGFTYWSPFRKLAFSPDGHFLAGIWPEGFELRYATSGGFDYRHRLPDRRDFTMPGFVAFTRHSGTCVFGWESEFHVLDISTGTSKPIHRIDAGSRPVTTKTVKLGRIHEERTVELAAPFHDAAFTGSGRHFATVEQPGRWKRWDAFVGGWRTSLDQGAEQNGRLKLWDLETWKVTHEYDWGCGALTCLAFTADGSAGVCGTADGRLVQFDVDE